MHEIGLIQDALIRAIEVAERAGAPRIEQVTFVISDGGHLTSDTVQDLFRALSIGTIAEGAEVVVDGRPDERRCPECETLSSASDEDIECPTCRFPLPPFGSRSELVLASVSIPESNEVEACV